MLYDQVSRLIEEAFRLNANIVRNTMLLTVAMNYAWTASRQQEPRRTTREIKAPVKRPLRTSRSKRRGGPTEFAAQGLSVL